MTPIKIMTTDQDPRILPLEHRGFYGTIQYDPENATHPYHGKIFGVADENYSSYRGTDQQDLFTSFILAVDNYHEHCKENGITERKEMITAPDNSFFTSATHLLGFLDDINFMLTGAVTPLLRTSFNRFIQTSPTTLDSEFPSGIYNLHRILQYMRDFILMHIDKYGVVQANTVTCLPERFPALPYTSLTIDLGSRTDTYSDAYAALDDLSSLLRTKDYEYLCSATFHTSKKLGGKMVPEYTVQFPDIL